MAKTKIGILHPGQMGAAVARAALAGGHEVYWAGQGRGEASRRRAGAACLIDAVDVAGLCACCEVIVSICPPGFAEAVATEVLGKGFRGIFIDANAISPQRAVSMGESMGAAGATFIDASIIGLPDDPPGRARFYFSGGDADRSALLFSAGNFSTEVLEGPPGRASALKMCYALHNKGLAALRTAMVAAAEALGVTEPLARQFEHADTPWAKVTGSVRHVGPKAWRFVAEMEEIEATLRAAGVPAGFPMAAAEIYSKLSPLRDRQGVSLEETLRLASGKILT